MSPSMGADTLPIAVREYSVPVCTDGGDDGASPSSERTAQGDVGASRWRLIVNTKTTADAAQQLQVGSYQIRTGVRRAERGLFFDPVSLTDAERSLLYRYAAEHGLEVRTVAEFIEDVFFPVVYERRGLCIGFDLPFVLSRIAVGHCTARTMPNAFSFQLSGDTSKPRIQVRHLNRRSALIQFTAPRKQRSSRSERHRGTARRVRRGHFADVHTLAGALLGGSWSLKDLAEHLETSPKLGTNEHGCELTEEYLEYAVNDVHVTWECFERLRKRYESYGLTKTPIEHIYSEASLGKACLRQMGITSWRALQPDFPPELIGSIMQSYYGGRSEVRLRRVVTQVLYCDFTATYPTVCTLMGLWRFVTAERITYADATQDVVELLATVTLDHLRCPELWKRLTAIVRIRPDDDLLPVRAKYDGEQYTIGQNYLTAPPLWYTLADVVAAVIRTGKVPEILQAIRFEPDGMQDGLEPICLAGNPDYRIDPTKDDFYRELVNLRHEVDRAGGDTDRADRFSSEGDAIKTTANAASYGIFAELNVNEGSKPETMVCYGSEGKQAKRMRTREEPGSCFHPLLATLIAGAARLMLASAEKLALDCGVDWAFCDTDSMAFARPDSMSAEAFIAASGSIVQWFDALNPYKFEGSILKIEKTNYRIVDGKTTDEREHLYCWPIAAKRYALFNLDPEGRPVVRKASGHGLGHLFAPYQDDEAPTSIPAPIVPKEELGVDRWEHDVWYRIVEAALRGHPDMVKLDDLPGFDQPAVSRYAATTPKLLTWYRSYNGGRAYREQVRPFGFLLAFQPRGALSRGQHRETIHVGKMPNRRARRQHKRDDVPRSVAPYDQDHSAAAHQCFDRKEGKPVDIRQLQTYRQALTQYHLRPEAKFGNGRAFDRGETSRRHIVATSVRYIGKEANRWEEQFHLGQDPEAQTEYRTVRTGLDGRNQQRIQRVLDRVRERRGRASLRQIAEQTGVHYSHLSEALAGKRRPSKATVSKMEAWLAGQKST